MATCIRENMEIFPMVNEIFLCASQGSSYENFLKFGRVYPLLAPLHVFRNFIKLWIAPIAEFEQLYCRERKLWYGLRIQYFCCWSPSVGLKTREVDSEPFSTTKDLPDIISLIMLITGSDHFQYLHALWCGLQGECEARLG